MSGPARTSVQDQLMRMAMVIITVSIVLSCAGSLYLTLKSDRESLDSNLLNSAYILAETPLVRNALTGQAPQEELAAFLDDYMPVLAMEEAAVFVDAFRLGARIMMEVLAKDPDQ